MVLIIEYTVIHLYWYAYRITEISLLCSYKNSLDINQPNSDSHPFVG